LAVGAIERGLHYLELYPGVSGWLLFAVCPIAVFMAGARLMEFTRKDNQERRRKHRLCRAAGHPAGSRNARLTRPLTGQAA
jgi:hypothetical protein